MLQELSCRALRSVNCLVPHPYAEDCTRPAKPIQTLFVSPPKNARRTTIKDIARHLKLNPSTVSRALHNHPHISETTRKNVQAAAKKLRYEEDPALKSLVAYRWHPEQSSQPRSVALLLDQPDADLAKTGEGTSLRLVDIQARSMGYKIERHYLANYTSPRALSRMLYHRGIQGILIGRTTHAYDANRFLFDWDQFTAVAVNVGMTAFPCHSVLPNHMNAVLRLWRTLRQHNYHRIGAILSNDLLWRVHLQEIGAVSCGLLAPSDTNHIPICFDNPATEPKKVLKWFETHRPEVVIGRMAALRVLEAGGIQAPKNMHFAALDVPENSGKAIAGFGFADTIFSESLILLDSLLRLNRRGIPSIRQVLLISPPWISGKTLPGIKAISL